MSRDHKYNVSIMSHCAIHSCKTSIYNKAPGVSLHPCPKNEEMRKKWLIILRNKCPMLDYSISKICSKHFENKYFDSQRRLKDNAIPTLFSSPHQQHQKAESPMTSTRIDRLLNKMSQSLLMADIKNTTAKLREPANLSDFLTQSLQTRSDAPTEYKLWLLIKKQEHLNTRLMELVVKNKGNTETTQKTLESAKQSKKEMEKSVETYKYIVKCLQEKQATLEEQIEILAAVESRT